MLALPTPLKEQLRLQNINLTNASSSSSSSSSSSPLETRIRALLLSADVLLFMKGSPSEPKCGFSRDLVKILHDEDISFKSFDILGDEDVRQGLKILSDWPTFPQVGHIRRRFRVLLCA